MKTLKHFLIKSLEHEIIKSKLCDTTFVLMFQ